MSNCSLSIENLAGSEFCKQNMSGVKTIYFCPVGDITAINAQETASKSSFVDYVEIGSSADTGKAFTAATGKGFAKIYCAKDMGELKYAVQGSRVGCRSVKATLEIFHPGMARKLAGFLATMQNQEMLIVAKCNNGDVHLLGDLERGATIADGVEMTTGKAVTDDNGATITFEWDTPMPRIFFEGFDPEDSEKGLPLIA